MIGGAVLRHAHGDGVAQVMTSKSLTQATVDVIDPESGTSSGTGGSDVRLAVGDIISFKFKYTPVPDKVNRGLQGYLTEYLPPNTEVVGVRITDANNNTIEPRYPGIAVNGCSGGSTCNTFNNLSCTVGTAGCSAGGTRSFQTGSISQVHGDVGIFYSTDPLTARNPAGSFITMNNGIQMSQQPASISPGIVALLNDTTGPYFAHNQWDYDQVKVFGAAGGQSVTGGDGNTPFGYGSMVAGPGTYYPFEGSQGAGASIVFDNVNGPWERIRYPGSTIANGAANIGSSSNITRTLTETAAGFDLTPASASGIDANAIRVALGETRTGEPGFVEVAVRVTGLPIDPGFLPSGGNVDCGEVVGTDTSSRGTNSGAKDNGWPTYVGSPACVFLRLLFELEVDKTLATNADNLTYTLRGSNLSVTTETNAVARLKFDSSRQSFVSGTPAPSSITTCPDDGTLQCLNYNLGTLAPGADYTITAVMDVGGGGQTTNVMTAQYISSQLPAPGFSTQSLTIVSPIAVPKVSIAPTWDVTATSATQGSTASLTGFVSNIGTEIFSGDQIGIVLPTGWTISGNVTLSGTTLSCASGCGTSAPVYNAGVSYTPFQQRPLAFSVNVPSGGNGATGLYRIDLQLTGMQSGFGGTWETYFPKAATVNVNQRRTVKPIITCPIGSTTPSISGTSEADAAISLRFNLQQRGTATAASSPAATAPWTSNNYGAFGELYGGLEVTATAQAPGELTSESSLPCFVTSQRQCSDGLDNDGDGMIDFPNDVGCDSPSDNTENTPGPQCSDGADNDADNQTDWPFDVGCQGPTDATENSGAACGDGLDNDGDGATDFPSDPDCTSATDGSETFYQACQDGLDNDGDALRDFPNDPGCHSPFDSTETDANATPIVKPRLLLLFDSSGSMNWNTCNDTFTGGDGSSECPGSNVACATCTSGTCGNAFADDSRLFKVKAGITDAVSAFGEVEYGLMRFHQRGTDFACPGTSAGLRSGAWQGGGAAPCGFVNTNNPGFNAGDLLVSFARDNEQTLLDWIDGDSNYPGTPQAFTDQEIRGSGTTPLGGALVSANTYLDTVRTGDTQLTCRPYRVILITDGAETCGGNPVQAATDLRNDGALVYVVGFATPDAAVIANLNAIAAAGGGRSTAIFVDDEVELSAAIADIIQDSVIGERCNTLDDDCDVQVDEDFPELGQTCNNGQFGVCARTGVRVCAGDQLGTTCSAPTITPGTETCNGLDDDCDRSIDENLGGCQTCTPEERAQPEICNNLDDNCNGQVDEAPIPGVGTSCGLDIGECNPGTLQCTGGNLQCTGGTGPTTETCNSLDDDCDTLTDEISIECYTGGTGCVPDGAGGYTCTGTCRSGTQTCNGNMLGTCTGQVGPGTEACNGLDDDCDNSTDEAFPGLGGACDNGQQGVCRQTGTLVCNANGTGTQCTAPTVQPGIEVCNNMDDDCDGRTDEMLGPPIGTTCGGSGSCSAGTFACVNGQVECVGSMGGMPEICNGVDDDCDNSIDEPPVPGTGGNCVDAGFGTVDMNGNCTGGACDVGECEFGELICAGGGIVCDGYIGPRPEVCNGLDDDCDGNADDLATCPVTGQACLEGMCVNPCAAGEFPCPFGFFCEMGPVPGGSDDFCVPDPCATVNCDPGELCNTTNGQCEDLCDDVTCPEGLECFGGICQDCFSLGCDPGELCVREGTGPGECVADPCFGVDCEANEACIDGTCTAVTCDPACNPDERCDRGECVDDPCNGVTCNSRQICDPRSGECVEDICEITVCGNGQVCNPGNGECINDPCQTINCPAPLQCFVDFDGTGQCRQASEPECASPPCTITTGGGGGCDAGGGSSQSGMAAMALALLSLMVRRTRRSPSRPSPSSP
ncbi:MAG TPA: vWA domain-containing protein [Kofleriaceae bacterium]|nr:vWA domain-containing protein [Kofleriaceae bacterium]